MKGKSSAWLLISSSLVFSRISYFAIAGLGGLLVPQHQVALPVDQQFMLGSDGSQPHPVAPDLLAPQLVVFFLDDDGLRRGLDDGRVVAEQHTFQDVSEIPGSAVLFFTGVICQRGGGDFAPLLSGAQRFSRCCFHR